MTTLMYKDFKLGDLVEVMDDRDRPGGYGETLGFDTSTGRATIRRHSLTEYGRTRGRPRSRWGSSTGCGRRTGSAWSWRTRGRGGP